MSYYYDPELDRKSSRGMIYENEELRLRTININAEVERGQSDIKRLRRENEQLRREIWTLRDECDRLNKRFKSKLLEHEHGGCSGRGSGGSGYTGHGGGHCGGSNSDDSDSCDTCKLDDGSCSDDCCSDGYCNRLQSTLDDSGDVSPSVSMSMPMSTKGYPLYSDVKKDQVKTSQTAFDHLSVVSEETLSNSEVMASQHDNHFLTTTATTTASAVNGHNAPFTNLIGPLTPLTPVEKVANQLSDLQAIVPPLSYFENILDDHMGSTIGNSPETASSPTTGKIVKHTNGWDYNLESPFSKRKYPQTHSAVAIATDSQLHQDRYPRPQLTTFSSTNAQSTTSSPYVSAAAAASKSTSSDVIQQNGSDMSSVSGQSKGDQPQIETVSITTAPTTEISSSPKQFFSPLKPRLKLNTSLANKTLIPAVIPIPPTLPSTKVTHQNCNPPDIFVANALASPYTYQPPPVSMAVRDPSPPPLPQRSTCSHVSPEHFCHHHHSHHMRHSHEPKEQWQWLRKINTCLTVDTVAAAGGGAAIIDNAINTCYGSVRTASNQPMALVVEKPNTSTNPNDPIYATAQNVSNNLVPTAAVITPLMVATIKRSNSIAISSGDKLKTKNSINTSQTITDTQALKSVTDSVNLETILNDIETISEDILALQLDKKDNKANQEDNSLKSDDKAKKPYRSEMNLILTFDGENPTITANAKVPEPDSPTPTNTDTQREDAESPSPSVPDAMAPFPDTRTYIGFDRVNSAVQVPVLPIKSKPPLPPSQLIGGGGGTTTNKSAPMPPPRSEGLSRSKPQSPVHQEYAARQPLAPNKSHLYTALANAAAKRMEQYNAPAPTPTSTPTHLTRSGDAESTADVSGSKDSADTPMPTPEASVETVGGRKTRRVSIVCGDISIPETSSESRMTSPQKLQQDATGPESGPSTPTTTTTPTPTTDSPTLRSTFKSSSHSTPNSPRTLRKQESNGSVPNILKGDGNDQQQQQQQQDGKDTQSQRKSNQDSSHANGNDPTIGTPVLSRSKCSRRHSDGTVISNANRTSGASAAGGHHHHHNRHHHHHHQRSSSIISTNLQHHSRNSRQDSHLDGGGGGSMSERNSNSLASSRESSTSFSMRSQKRKISISSHTGGKIPWCGCWGNGCL